MAKMDLNTEFLVDVFGQMLGAIDTSVLTARTTKGEHERGKSSVDVALHMEVGKAIDTIEESEDFAILLQEVYHGLVETCHLPVLLITSRVVSGTTVKHITTAIAALVLRNALW